MLQHIEDRKKGLTRIFAKHGMSDITVSAQRLKVEGDLPDSQMKFEEYKEDEILHQDGDIIYLEDFHEWAREQETPLEENGLFLVPSRPFTENEYLKVRADLDRFRRRSTSHGLLYEIQSDKYEDTRVSFQFHLNMS